MPIFNLLLNKAFSSGTLTAVETRESYLLMAKLFGVSFTVATVEKSELTPKVVS